jgi:hypothetical protein
MFGHWKIVLQTNGVRIAINPDRFDKLITALRTAVDNDGTQDKEATSYNEDSSSERYWLVVKEVMNQQIIEFIYPRIINCFQ